ncbi:benzyl alcohol O-benzoyltransferase-like [Silene latifolia]|uniref:benzyl alcohol O-benzoyltransferase-like n=1 Tax=Silene latifolia TaxID=37657 RepID=UPI003D773126
MTEINGTNMSLTFKVTRQAPELIRPAKATPYESKELSDLDNVIRMQTPLIMLFKNPSKNLNPYVLSGSDPVKVIKDGIAKALVPYYPLAGRLRETREGKLEVECNGEGVLFVEADADVTLDDFGEPIHPPFPCSDELLHDVPGSSGILHSPLALIQVTRLKCGGFIFAIRMNHTMTDGVGLLHFLNAVGEFARGAQHPSISPVWMRHLLNSAPINSSHKRHEDVRSKISESTDTPSPPNDLVNKCFFFGSAEIDSLQQQSVQTSSTFELILAHTWRCRSMALYNDSDQESRVKIAFAMNIRSKYNPPLPKGYYGNVIATPTAQATTTELSENPFHYSVDLVKKAKDIFTEEYLRSLAFRTLEEGRLARDDAKKFDRLLVTDHSRLGLNCLDFGLGQPVYGGHLKGSEFHPNMGYISRFTPCKPFMELGVLVPICLPSSAMKKFVKLISRV